MPVIEGEVKKWGNSLAIIIPADIINREKLREKQKIRLLLLRESVRVLRETFGMGKDKLIKSAQQMKDELRRELYND